MGLQGTITGPFGTTAGTPNGNGIVVINQGQFVPNEMTFTLTGTLAAGETYVIEPGILSCRKNGQNAPNDIIVPSTQARWFWLVPGMVNTIVIADQAGSGQLTGGTARIDFFLRWH